MESSERVRLAMESLQAGKSEEAEAHLRHIPSGDVQYAQALKVLAGIYWHRRDFLGAKECCEQLLRFTPDNPHVLNSLGVLEMELGQPDRAVRHLIQATELAPGIPAFFHNLGIGLNRLDRIGEAIIAYRTAIRLNARSAESVFNLAQMELLQGDAAAIESLQRVAVLEPTSPRGLLCQAYALFFKDHDLDRAVELATSALEGDPKLSNAHALIGMIRQQQGNLLAGTESLQQAIALRPTEAAPYFDVAYNQKITEDDRGLVTKMEAMLGEPERNRSDRRILAFALGKSYDDLKEYSSAMERYTLANELSKELTRYPFDRTAYSQETDVIIRGFEALASSKLPTASSDSERPIFIVGMYRSGTTLVEQVLSSHSQVAAGGELRFWFDVRKKLIENAAMPTSWERAKQVGTDYLAVLDRTNASRRFVTDKQPENFRVLGLLHLLYPNARFIFCRRLPVDNALSLYMTYFSQPPSYASDPGDIVFAYAEHKRLMDYWKSQIPSDRLLEVDYTSLVQDFESETRMLLAFCDLAWESSCLSPEANPRVVRTASQWQVRQPVYQSSVDRWKHYEPYLGEFRALLESETHE